MRLSSILTGAVLGIGLLGFAYYNLKRTSQQNKTNALAVMSFNLRYGAVVEPNSWQVRRPIMQRCLKAASPDLIGTQEGLYEQLNDMEKDLPEYRRIGYGREGGSENEHMAIYYKTTRFKPLAYADFWLSETPKTIGSKTWGTPIHKHPRMVTWVRFKDLLNDREFLLFNTHFAHDSQEAREKSAELLLKTIREINKNDLPVIVTGDFNEDSRKEGQAHKNLSAGGYLQDTWSIAIKKPADTMGTVHNYKGRAIDNNERIDWILLHGSWTVLNLDVILCHEKGQYPSDHFPLQAVIEYGQESKVR